MKRASSRLAVTTALALALAAVTLSAARDQKPLVNADVVTMVKRGLPERTIIRAVQSNPGAFDVSPEGLIALHEAGVSQKVMDAMIAATKKQATARGSRRGAGGPASTRSTSSRVSQPPRGIPLVTLLQGETPVVIPWAQTRLAQSKTKPSSLGALAQDEALGEAVRAGSRAVRDTSGRVIGGAAGQVTKSVAGRLLDNGDKTVTYVWMVAGTQSETVVPSPTMLFEVSLNNAVALRQEDFTPAVVKLTPVKGGRLVGATEGKTNATSSTVMDWPIYTGFVENRVEADVLVRAAGVWRVVVRTPLEAGDYAIVLRPASKGQRFSGADVARNQGAGIAFNSVWSFTVR